MGIKLTAAQINKKNRKNLAIQGKLLEHNLTAIEDYVRVKAVKALAMIANDLLGYALPMTPYDTGKLRASGRARVILGGKPIIVGRADSSFPHELVDAQIPVFTANDVRGVKKIRSAVYFNRRNEEGKDIALWAHENLLPWVPRPKPPELRGVWVATKKFTGPKYLENALNMRRLDYKQILLNLSNIQDMETDIKAISRVLQRKRTQYEVDVVELVRSNLTSLGINIGLREGIRGKNIRGGVF